MKGLAIAGDFYHKPEGLRKFIKVSSPAEMEWDWQPFPPSLDFSILEKDPKAYDILLFASENRVEPEKSNALWMSEEIAGILDRWVIGGGAFIALHTGMASYPEGGTYRKMIGGGFEFHPAPHPEYKIIPQSDKKDHPILKGIESFSIKDELYFVHREPEESTLLAVSRCESYGSSSACWCRKQGKGRVAALTPGHLPETQANPHLIKLLSNGMNWVMKRTVSSISP